MSKAAGAARQRERDQNRAMYMKKHGIRRALARCPICNNVVSINKLYQHIVTCR
jgi:hypothetical protein